MLRTANGSAPVLAAVVTLDQRVIETIEALYPRLFRYARFRLERSDAEDATSAALERMWRVRGRYRGDRGPLDVWLREVGYNAIRDEVRRAYRRPPTIRIDDLELPDQDSDLEAVGRLADIRRAIAALSDADAEIIANRYALGISNEETARLLGRTPGAMATATHRALRRLREEMLR